MWRWPILLSFFVTQPTLGQPLSKAKHLPWFLIRWAWLWAGHRKQFPCRFVISNSVLGIDIQPNDLIVVQGWAASFNCSVQSLTASITWSINGQLLVTGRRFQIQTNGSLFINETQHQDSGFYQCLASSGNQTISSRRAQLSFACMSSDTGRPHTFIAFSFFTPFLRFDSIV